MFGFGAKYDPKKITSEVEKGEAILVDVRTDDEWNNGHAQPAIHLSVDRISKGEVPTTDKQKKLYLYCASGGRSGMATHTLKQKGYNCENLGGFSGWKSAGGPTV